MVSWISKFNDKDIFDFEIKSASSLHPREDHRQNLRSETGAIEGKNLFDPLLL